jgi:hypothetical protein
MFVTIKTGIHSPSWYMSILDRRKSKERIILHMTRDSIMILFTCLRLQYTFFASRPLVSLIMGTGFDTVHLRLIVQQLEGIM